MDLVDKIEHARFLGREFLVWLWFESEVLEGQLEASGIGAVELFPEAQIVLVQEKEQSRMKGAVPSMTPEAHEALRQGKLPTQAKFRVVLEGQEFSFVLAADTLAMTSVKIPAVLKEETDEQFYERMHLVEDLEALVGALYGTFVSLRLSQAWDGVAETIRAWVGDQEIDADGYRRVRGKVKALGAKKK